MIEDILNRLRSLAGAFPEEERPTFSPPATADSLRAFESAVGHALPVELREFLTQCDDVVAMDIHNGYWLGGVAELTRGVRLGSFPRAVEYGGESVPAAPVATDGGGNAFLISLSDGRVWRQDHETGRVEEVAGSFVVFLGRVAEDWEHAAAGDTGWRYLVSASRA